MMDNDDTLRLNADVRATRDITYDDLLDNGDQAVAVPAGSIGRINAIKYVPGGALLVVRFVGAAQWSIEPAWVVNV